MHIVQRFLCEKFQLYIPCPRLANGERRAQIGISHQVETVSFFI
jgi:hypothetical protein